MWFFHERNEKSVGRIHSINYLKKVYDQKESRILFSYERKVTDKTKELNAGKQMRGNTRQNLKCHSFLSVVWAFLS